MPRWSRGSPAPPSVPSSTSSANGRCRSPRTPAGANGAWSCGARAASTCGRSRREPIACRTARRTSSRRSSSEPRRRAPSAESELVRATRPASARNRPRADRAVVVGELFACADPARRPDPDGAAVDLEPAVRPARVIDEPRDVAADVRVAAPSTVDPERPDAAFRQIPLLALRADGVRNQLSRVVDNPPVLIDRLSGEDAEAVEERSPAYQSQQPSWFGHAVSGYRRAAAAVKRRTPPKMDARPMSSPPP